MVQTFGSPRYGDFKCGLELILLSGSDASRVLFCQKMLLPCWFTPFLLLKDAPLSSSIFLMLEIAPVLFSI